MSSSRPVRVRKVFKGLLFTSLSIFTAMLLFGFGGCDRSKSLGKDVLATVGSETITVEDFKSAFLGPVPSDFAERSEDLGIIIRNRLAARRALKEGFMDDPEVIAKIEEFYARRLPEMFKEKLASGITVSDVELLGYKKPVATALYLDYLSAGTLDDAEAAMAEVKKGVPFEKAASERAMSSRKIKYNSVQVGLDDDLYPAGVRAMLNRLKPGEVSPITRMEVGYFIYRLNSRKDGEQQWEEQKEELRGQIRAGKVQQAVDELLEKLRAEADIKINQDLFDETKDAGWAAVVNGVAIKPLDKGLDPNDPHEPHRTLNRGTKTAALMRLIDGMLLSQEARKSGLQKDPKFQKELKFVVDEALASVYMEKKTEVNEVTPEEIKDYYDKNKQRFAKGAGVRVSRILLNTEAEAMAVQKRLGEGMDFAAAAKEYSRDEASRDKGGDMGYITMEGLKEDMYKTLSGLKVGGVSRPVKSDYGYELLKLTDKKEGKVPDISDIMDTVRKRVRLNKKSENVEALQKSLFEKADVKVNEQLLKSM